MTSMTLPGHLTRALVVAIVCGAGVVEAADRRPGEHPTVAAPAVAPSSGGLPAVGAIAEGPAPAGSIATASLAAEVADGASAGATAVQSSGGGAPQLRFYALDALGSVRVVFDGHGNVIGRADYEPFGAPVASSTTGTLPRQRFTGQERDGEVGTDYFGARTYVPVHGRMLSVDPLYVGAVADPQRWNRYSYALNSPIVMTDPDGRTAVQCSGPTVGSLGHCSSNVHYPNGPGMNTLSPGQGPLLNSGGINGEPYDYLATMYGPGFQWGPGQQVSHPTIPDVETGQQEEVGQPPAKPAPPKPGPKPGPGANPDLTPFSPHVGMPPMMVDRSEMARVQAMQLEMLAAISAGELFAARATLFGFRGLLNSNNILRVGMSGKAVEGYQGAVFRIAIGSKNGPLPTIHLDLWPPAAYNWVITLKSKLGR